MTTLDEIKAAIEKLSLEQRGQLARWFHGWEEDAWDHQIKRDATSGKLDNLLEEVDDEIKTGRLQDMP